MADAMAPIAVSRDSRAIANDRALRLAAALLGGAALLALTDAGGIAITLPRPAAGAGLRVAHYLFDAAETLGIGALAGAAAGAFVRFVRVPGWAHVGIAIAVTASLLEVAIGENLTRVSSLVLNGRFETALFIGFRILLAVAVPGAYLLARWATKLRFLRLLPLPLALAAMAGNYLPQPDEYRGIHGVVAWGAAMVGGAAIAPFLAQWGGALWRRERGRAALAALALFAACGALVPPPNAVRFELFRLPCAVAPWVLATALWRAPRLHSPTPPPDSPWFRDRAGLPPSPPSPRLLPEDAVVVLITIDGLRADAVEGPANDALFPTLTRLEHEGVRFTHASAAASQTPLSLAAIFSGRTFSELLWTDHGQGNTRFLYPADDTSARFPELLSAHGVPTANFASLVFLTNEFGVVRGFEEQTVTVSGIYRATAKDLIDSLIERLETADPGPLFLYTHLMEPHAPYDFGPKQGTERERYLFAAGVADAEIRRVLAVLDARFGNRWALFVSADHGEAFGEHATFGHAKTLYEELLHVPLLVRGPMFPPRTIATPVGLVDLGPTILDLFGLPTPATFLGQSLVPILAGGSTTLTRPLIAEGRLRRSLTMPDGLKVIEDLRRKLVEVYDLPTDPGETRNLFDEQPARADAALSALRAFFAVHTRGGENYVPPYKP